MAKKKNEHSTMFEKIKEWYKLWETSKGKKGWSPRMVADAVVKGKISPAEYEEITGKPYEEV